MAAGVIQELVESLTVLSRLVELEPAQAELLRQVVATRAIAVADLTQAHVFPVPVHARKIRRTLSIENADDVALF